MRNGSPSARQALALGAVVSVAYLVLAVVSGHLSPLARRPLLDGVAPPPQYRFASPPPNLASINERPLPGRFTLPIRNGTVSEGLIATRDSQASVLLFGHSIQAPAHQRSVTISLQPVAPAKDASVPPGRTITGNVYRVEAAFEPSGDPVEKLQKSGIVTLVYPALAGPHHVRRMLSSSDGRRFTEIQSIDSTVQQQVTAHVSSFGYFAVGTKAVSAPVQPSGGGSRFPITAVVVGAAVLVAIVIGWLRWRERSNAARPARDRRPPPRNRAGGGTRRRR